MQVADTCLELLHMEMVESVVTSPIHTAQRELVYFALEGLGFDVGHRMIHRVVRDKPLLTNTLECIKFLCKEFWMECFKKSIDSLRTHKNVNNIFLLKDNSFRWLKRISSGSFPTVPEGQYQRSPEDYAIFPAGLLRGALYGLGIQAAVEPILGPEPHACTFQVVVKSEVRGDAKPPARGSP